MIDFKNANFIKLKSVSDTNFYETLSPILIDGENIVSTYRGIRDGVVFTNKRIISINIQGITGTKKDFTSMPYNKIQVFSVETSGLFDLDGEIELWFSGIGKVRFEFSENSDISKICKIISSFVLK